MTKDGKISCAGRASRLTAGVQKRDRRGDGLLPLPCSTSAHVCYDNMACSKCFLIRLMREMAIQPSFNGRVNAVINMNDRRCPSTTRKRYGDNLVLVVRVFDDLFAHGCLSSDEGILA